MNNRFQKLKTQSTVSGQVFTHGHSVRVLVARDGGLAESATWVGSLGPAHGQNNMADPGHAAHARRALGLITASRAPAPARLAVAHR
jgi:hypothetical protein